MEMDKGDIHREVFLSWIWIHIECTQDISMLLIIPVIEIDFLLNTFKNFFLKNLNLNYLYTKRHLFFFNAFYLEKS